MTFVDVSGAMHEAMATLPLDLAKVLETLEPISSQSSEWFQHFMVASESSLRSWDDEVVLEASRFAARGLEAYVKEKKQSSLAHSISPA